MKTHERTLDQERGESASRSPDPAALVDSDVELSIVMPCLNEAKTLPICIRKAQESLEQLGVRGEVVVADNGSDDGSVEIARSLGARVVHVTRKGYGAALSAGSREALGHYILMADADDSYDLGDIGGFVERLRAGDELVMGTRLRGKIMPGAMPWKNRYIGNPLLTGVLRRLFKAPISDAHCGMRAFSREAFQRMDLRTPGMEFASEMVVRAAKLGLTMSEVPIVFHPDGRDRPPHLRPYRDGWRHLKLMLMFSPAALFLVPGLVLGTVGLLLMVAQLFAPVDDPLRIGGFRLDFHWAIFGSFLTLLGYQLVLVHFLARVYSITHRVREESRSIAAAFRVLRLERVLALAGIAMLAGLALDLIVVLRWFRADFGPLLSGNTRLFIFGSTLFALGLQTFFHAFFFSMLGDEYQRNREEPGRAEVSDLAMGSGRGRTDAT